MQDNRKSKELAHSKRKSAGKTKAPGVRPKIHKQKSVYTSESDDNNDEPEMVAEITDQYKTKRIKNLLRKTVRL